jgi:hypothetical protein
MKMMGINIVARSKLKKAADSRLKTDIASGKRVVQDNFDSTDKGLEWPNSEKEEQSSTKLSTFENIDLSEPIFKVGMVS